MNTIDTVLVKGENGEPLIINKSDYDSKKHELVEKEAGLDTFDREAGKEALKKAGVSFANNASNAKLQTLLDELNAVPEEKTFAVEPKDDKFIIVDSEGVQVGEEYDTADVADEMLEMLKG